MNIASYNNIGKFHKQSWMKEAKTHPTFIICFMLTFKNEQNKSMVLQNACVLSRVRLWDPINYSLPGFSVHGIFQARILERVAISSSRASSWPRNRTPVSCISCIGSVFFTTEPSGDPLELVLSFISTATTLIQAPLLKPGIEKHCHKECLYSQLLLL